MTRGPFTLFFLFCFFCFSKPLFWATQNGNFLTVKGISCAGKNIRKSNFAPSEKFSGYAPGGSGIATGGSREGRVPPLTANNLLKIGEKREKIRKKKEKIGKKRKNREGFFTLPLLTDRAVYATGRGSWRELRFGFNGGVPLEPQDPYPFLRVILAENVLIFRDISQNIGPFFTIFGKNWEILEKQTHV